VASDQHRQLLLMQRVDHLRAGAVHPEVVLLAVDLPVRPGEDQPVVEQLLQRRHVRR
jgi:hypothetical protein